MKGFLVSALAAGAAARLPWSLIPVGVLVIFGWLTERLKRNHENP